MATAQEQAAADAVATKVGELSTAIASARALNLTVELQLTDTNTRLRARVTKKESLAQAQTA